MSSTGSVSGTTPITISCDMSPNAILDDFGSAVKVKMLGTQHSHTKRVTAQVPHTAENWVAQRFQRCNNCLLSERLQPRRFVLRTAAGARRSRALAQPALIQRSSRCVGQRLT